MYDQEAWEDGYQDAINNEPRKTRTIYAVWDTYVDLSTYWYDRGYDAGMEAMEHREQAQCC